MFALRLAAAFATHAGCSSEENVPCYRKMLLRNAAYSSRNTFNGGRTMNMARLALRITLLETLP